MSCLDCPYKLREYDFTNGEYMDIAIWCWKVDGRPKCIGSCGDDLESEENAKRITKKQRIHKYERYLKHQNHLKYLKRVSCGYPSAVTYEDERWIRRQDIFQIQNRTINVGIEVVILSGSNDNPVKESVGTKEN